MNSEASEPQTPPCPPHLQDQVQGCLGWGLETLGQQEAHLYPWVLPRFSSWFRTHRPTNLASSGKPPRARSSLDPTHLPFVPSALEGMVSRDRAGQDPPATQQTDQIMSAGSGQAWARPWLCSRNFDRGRWVTLQPLASSPVTWQVPVLILGRGTGCED